MELTKRQEDIVQAAISLIAREGYKHLTTKNLARELQLTEAALYRHFTNKNDLITKILEHFSEISGAVLQQIKDSGLDPLERVHRFVLNRYELFSANPDLAQVMFSEELFRYDPAFAGQMQSIMQMHRKAVVGYLRQARKQGQIVESSQPEELFRIIVGSMRMLVSQWNLSGQSFNLVAEGEKLWRTIRNLILVAQPGRA